MSGGEPVRVLYLGGLGRSGTTLLERVVGEVPGAAPVGETVHLWARDVRDDERCGCGEPFSRCPFWTEVGKHAFGGWDQVDVGRVLQLAARVDRTRFIPRYLVGAVPTAIRSDLAEYTALYARLSRAVTRVSGAEVVVDSSKHSSLAYCLAREPEIDLRVVHVVRDSRGVAYSWTKTVHRPETDGARVMATFSPTKTSSLWDAHNVAFSLLARRGVPVMRLRYEDFLADPVGATRRIADFAGLEAGPLPFLEPGAATLGPCHSAAGNPMRFTTGRVELRRDDAWQLSLPARQRRLVTALTFPVLAAYGYPLRPR